MHVFCNPPDVLHSPLSRVSFLSLLVSNLVGISLVSFGICCCSINTLSSMLSAPPATQLCPFFPLSLVSFLDPACCQLSSSLLPFCPWLVALSPDAMCSFRRSFRRRVLRLLCVCVCVCVSVYYFIKLHITAQFGPVIYSFYATACNPPGGYLSYHIVG